MLHTHCCLSQASRQVHEGGKHTVPRDKADAHSGTFRLTSFLTAHYKCIDGWFSSSFVCGFVVHSEPFSAGRGACVLCPLVPEVLVQPCPPFMPARSIWFTTVRANQCGQVQTDPYAGWLKDSSRKPALAADPRRCSFARGMGQLAVGASPAEQMGPRRGRQHSTHVRSGHMPVHRLCL